ncbi:MAG: hypothetical protein AAFU65_06260 [Pseudomonadota bacterium]
MAKSLPYRATTSSGEVIDLEFALHPQTQSAVRVSQVLTAVLGAIDREVSLTGDTGNGDVLQALAMALAVRARMIPMSADTLDGLARALVNSALDSARSASTHRTPIGHG